MEWMLAISFLKTLKEGKDVIQSANITLDNIV